MHVHCSSGSGEVVELVQAFGGQLGSRWFRFTGLIPLKEVIGQVGKDVRTEMFDAALFIVVKNWKHFNCPTV